MAILKSHYVRTVVVALLLVCGLLFGIWGTYHFPPDKSTDFYLFYIVLSVASVLIGNVLVSFLSGPITHSIAEEATAQVSNLAAIVERGYQETADKIEELSKAVGAFDDLGISGITIGPPELSYFDWKKAIQGSTTIRLSFKSSVKWFTTYQAELSAFLKNPASQLEVLLPDTSNEALVEQLALQRGKSKEDIRADVGRAVQIIVGLHKKNKGRVTCKVSGVAFFSHFYIFLNHAVVTMRSLHNGWRSPHFICDNTVNKKTMYAFCEDQFKEFWTNHSRLIDLNLEQPK